MISPGKVIYDRHIGILLRYYGNIAAAIGVHKCELKIGKASKEGRYPSSSSARPPIAAAIFSMRLSGHAVCECLRLLIFLMMGLTSLDCLIKAARRMIHFIIDADIKRGMALIAFQPLLCQMPSCYLAIRKANFDIVPRLRGDAGDVLHADINIIILRRLGQRDAAPAFIADFGIT